MRGSLVTGLVLRGLVVGKQYLQHFSIQDGSFYCLLADLAVRLTDGGSSIAVLNPFCESGNYID